MIAEMIGMPGVGKSTIGARVVEILSDQGVAARLDTGRSADPDEMVAMRRYRRNVARVARFASIPRLTVSAAVRATSRSDIAELRRLANREIGRRRIEDIPAGLVLLDEGPLHKLCLISAGGNVRQPLHLVEALSPPDLCVVLEADVDEAVRRIRSRPISSQVDEQPSEKLVRFLAAYRVGELEITRRLPCPVMRVNAYGQGVASRIASLIVSRVEASRT